MRHFSSRLSNALAYIVYAEIVGQFDTTSYHALRTCLQPASADRSPRRLFSAAFKCNTHAGRTWRLHDIISQRVVIKRTPTNCFCENHVHHETRSCSTPIVDNSNRNGMSSGSVMQGLVPCCVVWNLRRWGSKSSGRIVLSVRSRLTRFGRAALGCADLPARRRSAHGQTF